MSEPEMTEDQQVEAIYAYAAEQLASGVTPERVEANLLEKGLDPESAKAVVNNLVLVRWKAKQQAAQKDMQHGVLWVLGGLVVTGITYASAAGGGKYLLAWGPVVYGAIQFVRGFAKSCKD